jgi:hypothetical protein
MQDTIHAKPIYVTRTGSLNISAPIAIVWKHVLDYPSWQKYAIVETVAGEHNEEGEVLYLMKDEGLDMEAYHARTIQLIPERRALWKTFREGQDYFGIVDFNVEKISETETRFFYIVVYEFAFGLEGEQAAAFEAQMNSNFDKLTSNVIPRLKMVAEGGVMS